MKLKRTLVVVLTVFLNGSLVLALENSDRSDRVPSQVYFYKQIYSHDLAFTVIHQPGAIRILHCLFPNPINPTPEEIEMILNGCLYYYDAPEVRAQYGYDPVRSTFFLLWSTTNVRPFGTGVAGRGQSQVLTFDPVNSDTLFVASTEIEVVSMTGERPLSTSSRSVLFKTYSTAVLYPEISEKPVVPNP